jgi:hypothetical protein
MKQYKLITLVRLSKYEGLFQSRPHLQNYLKKRKKKLASLISLQQIKGNIIG